jgi:hypothetical protein
VSGLRRFVKQRALNVGFSDGFALLLAKALGVVRFGRWIRKSNVQNARLFSSRFDLYEYITGLIGNVPIQYLEFGVYRGESMSRWLQLNSCAQSTFHGFDSFEGLPEDWKHLGGVVKKGHFSTGGHVPVLSDPRIRWHVGWFQETLPELMQSLRSDCPMVINIDCDLYSSTLYVLSMLSPVLSRSIMIFDELSHVDHEFRALTDFCSAFGRIYEVLGATKDDYLQVAVQWV